MRERLVRRLGWVKGVVLLLLLLGVVLGSTPALILLAVCTLFFVPV